MAKAAKKIRYIKDGDHDGSYVRAWKEGRSTVVVSVWKGKKSPEGEPDDTWEMPAVLGPSVCIAQAVLQTQGATE